MSQVTVRRGDANGGFGALEAAAGYQRVSSACVAILIVMTAVATVSRVWGSRKGGSVRSPLAFSRARVGHAACLASSPCSAWGIDTCKMSASSVSWEVASVTAIDKACATHKTTPGQWIVCVAAEASSSAGEKDLGTFLVFEMMRATRSRWRRVFKVARCRLSSLLSASRRLWDMLNQLNRHQGMLCNMSQAHGEI